MKLSVTIALALVAIFVVPRAAISSCNSLPAASEANSGGGPAVYKSGLGSISQPYLLPGASAPVVIRADGVCVGDRGQGLTFEKPATDAYVVALVNTRQGANALTYPMVVTSSDAKCNAIRTAMTEAFGAKWSCTARGTVVPAIATEPGSIRFSLSKLPPELSPMAGATQAADALALASGSMKVFGTNDAAAVATLASALANKDCADLCSSLSQGHAFACLDSFYRADSGGGFVLSTIACDLAQLPTSLRTTKFIDQCTDASGNPLGYPKCAAGGGAQELDIYVDKCGNLKIPIDFAGLLDPANKIDERVASGASAVSRFTPGDPNDDEGLWVPGPEFIGSTPYGDPHGTLSSWQLPKMSVFWTRSSQAFGIRGLVDKSDPHFIHIVPRRAATLLCDVAAGDPEEGCEKLEEHLGIVQSLCACSDSHRADCKCKTVSDAAYFACEGGDFDGMPCTRSLHCSPGGKCTRQPKCQKKGAAVFSKNTPGGGVTPCWQDKPCATDEQCGYDLFDFRNRVNADNIVVLDSKIEKNAAPNRRGVCKGSLGTVCNDQNVDSKCTAQNDSCVGYELTAEGQP